MVSWEAYCRCLKKIHWNLNIFLVIVHYKLDTYMDIEGKSKYQEPLVWSNFETNLLYKSGTPYDKNSI